MRNTREQLLQNGTKIEKIPVTLSYRIIELFSEGLYSSPNKAFEELVANSYDANATTVWVIFPEDSTSGDPIVWVVDDGDSMDQKGIHELWQIAESNKRDNESSLKRLPIGKFGIGKLATYVLASELTFLCKNSTEYLVISMNFKDVSEHKKETDLELDLRVLKEDEAKGILAPLLRGENKDLKGLRLFGKKAPATWTVVALSDLKEFAKEINPGYLKWVLSSALPINPEFNLYFNGAKVLPSKTKGKVLKEWVIGEDDNVAEELSLEVNKEGKLVVPDLGVITGKATLYRDPLTRGKSAEWARSHGFFIKVRKRLINIVDPLFGLPALSHGPFNRFRLEVDADGLDDYLRSTREAVIETDGVRNLQRYLEKKFNEARTYYNNWVGTKEYAKSLKARVNSVPIALARKPLFRTVKKAFEGEIPSLWLSALPVDISKRAAEETITQLESEIESEDGFFEDVRMENTLSVEDGVAVFDPLERAVKVNIFHPFYANFADSFRRDTGPYQLLALTEVITEAYLYEAGLEYEEVQLVLRKRDRLLRELIYYQRLSAPLIIKKIGDSVNDEDALEEAVFEALSILGFQVTPLGKSGKPDGIAYAPLGIGKDENEGQKGFKFTYDAKSSKKGAVPVGDVRVSGLDRHREKSKADFVLVIAPRFEGQDDENSAVNQEVKDKKITLITADDFKRLIYIAATRQLGLSRIKEMLDNCRYTYETAIWITAVENEKADKPPIKEILEIIWELQTEAVDRVQFAAVSALLRQRDKKFSEIRAEDVKEWLRSVSMFCSGYVFIENDIVTLDMNPEKIMQQISVQSADIPEKYLEDSIFSKYLGTKTIKRKRRKKANKCQI